MSQPFEARRAAGTAGAWIATLIATLTLGWAPKVLADEHDRDRDRDHDRNRPAPTQLREKNASGTALTISTAGPHRQRASLFFTSIGSNGRSCDGLPPGRRRLVGHAARASASASRKRAAPDPIFRLDDGANSPIADVSTRAGARDAPTACCSSKGLIRVGMPHPGECRVRARAGRRSVRLCVGQRAVAVSPAAGRDQPALPQHRDVGWARNLPRRRRRPIACSTPRPASRSLHFDLADQANSATVTATRRRRTPLTPPSARRSSPSSSGSYTAQIRDDDAGRLTELRRARAARACLAGRSCATSASTTP